MQPLAEKCAKGDGSALLAACSTDRFQTIPRQSLAARQHCLFAHRLSVATTSTTVVVDKSAGQTQAKAIIRWQTKTAAQRGTYSHTGKQALLRHPYKMAACSHACKQASRFSLNPPKRSTTISHHTVLCLPSSLSQARIISFATYHKAPLAHGALRS